MKATLIIGASWFVVGFISYLLILIVFPPRPFQYERRDLTAKPKWQMPPAWNSLRINLFSLVGLLIVIMVAPILLSAFVCQWIFKPASPE